MFVILVSRRAVLNGTGRFQPREAPSGADQNIKTVSASLCSYRQTAEIRPGPPTASERPGDAPRRPH